MEEGSRPRQRFWQLSLRDLLWLTVVVALAAAWYVDRDQRVRSNSPGRYQAFAVPVGDSGSSRTYLLDTQTGQCWRLSGQNWVRYANPAPQDDGP